MKRVLFLILLFIISRGNLLTSPCSLDSICINESFPYFLCDYQNVGTQQFCVKNPYKVKAPNGVSLDVPLKMSGCFIYDDTTYHFDSSSTEHSITVYDTTIVPHDHFMAIDSDYTDPEHPIPIFGYDEYGDPIYHAYTTYDIVSVPRDSTYYTLDPCNLTVNGVFDLSMVQSAFDDALSAWTGICGGCPASSPSPQTCCVHFRWIQTDDFTWRKFNPRTVVAFTHRGADPVSMGGCNYLCDSVYVCINQTKLFTQPSSSDPCDYKQFFFTGNSTRSNYWNLKAVFEHEMGHLFGFGDEYGDSGRTCRHAGSIMDSINFLRSDRGLSPDDVCMYKKLYCWPEGTDVKELIEIDFGITIFPNPTNSNLINLQ